MGIPPSVVQGPWLICIPQRIHYDLPSVPRLIGSPFFLSATASVPREAVYAQTYQAIYRRGSRRPGRLYTPGQPRGRAVGAGGHPGAAGGHGPHRRPDCAGGFLPGGPRPHLPGHAGPRRPGEPVDLVTVSALLKERGQLEGVGVRVRPASANRSALPLTPSIIPLNLVHEKAVSRRLLDCTQEIAAGRLAPVEDVAEFLDEAEHKIFQVAEAKVRPGFSAPELPGGHRDRHPGGHLGPEGRLRVTSGFTDLDNYTAGFQASDLIILVARPSMGKTALALNIAVNAAFGRRRGAAQSTPPVPVAFFSLDVEGAAGAPLSQQRRPGGRFPDSPGRLLDRLGVEQAPGGGGDFLDCPIDIDDTPAATVLDIRAKSRRLKADGKLGLVIIDYLQLMQGRAEPLAGGSSRSPRFPAPSRAWPRSWRCRSSPCPSSAASPRNGRESAPNSRTFGNRAPSSRTPTSSCSFTGMRSTARTTPKTRALPKSSSASSATAPSGW